LPQKPNVVQIQSCLVHVITNTSVKFRSTLLDSLLFERLCWGHHHCKLLTVLRDRDEPVVVSLQQAFFKSPKASFLPAILTAVVLCFSVSLRKFNWWRMMWGLFQRLKNLLQQILEYGYLEPASILPKHGRILRDRVFRKTTQTRYGTVANKNGIDVIWESQNFNITSTCWRMG